MEISLLGFSERGRPPLLTLPRANISSVNSGRSSYSSGWMTCAETFARSDPKERGDKRLLAVIGFPHTEYMAIRATRGVANDDHSVPEHPKAEDSFLSVVLASVLGLKVCRLKYNFRVFEVELPVGEGACSFWGIVGDSHGVIVSTSTPLSRNRNRAIAQSRNLRTLLFDALVLFEAPS